MARVELRTRWRTYAGIALLLALAGGLSLFTLAGARRTQSSYPRFLRAANASTLVVTSSGQFDPKTNAAIAARPEVRESRTFVGFQVNVLVGGAPDFAQSFEASGTLDGRYFDEDRFAPIDGRRPERTRPDEVAVDELAARLYGYHVGQRLTLGTYDFAEEDAAFFAHPTPPKLNTHATIVGIGLFPDEVIQDESDRTPRMLLTPAFSGQAIKYVTYGAQGLVLRHGDADIAAIEDFVNARTPLGAVAYRATSVDVTHALRAVRPLSLSLAVFGLLVGLAGLVLVAQALGRSIRAQGEQRSLVRAVGGSPRVNTAMTVIGPVLAVVAGVLAAVLVAYVLSPLMPAGPVRRVEARPGLNLDVGVMAFGGAAIVVGLVAWIAAVSLLQSPWRLARRAPVPARSSAAALAGQAGLSPVVVTGLRFALEPDRAESVAPTRSVMLASVIAVLALVGAITFGLSFTNLVDHPRLYGWSADAVITAGNGYGNIPLAPARAILDADPAVQSWSGVYFGDTTITGVDVPLLGMDPGAALLPPILRGRTIATPDEIVLGGATASELHKGIGDRVTMSGVDARHTLTVVGIASFPAVGAVHAFHTALGTGGLVAHQVVPGFDLDITAQQHGDFGPRGIFVRFRPGTDVHAELVHLSKTTAPLSTFAGLDVLPVQRPAEITTSSTVANLPIVLAVGLALAAIASVGLALGSVSRRRRRDLAILRAIGFTRGQVAATMSWLATATIVVGLVVGVPVGVVVGRSLWRVFADQLHVVDAPHLPVAVVLVVVIGALGLANAVAALPARRASRVDTASLLRPE